MRNLNKENGAVLLTTLLLMTIMVAVTVAIVDNIKFSIRRATSVQMRTQVDWYIRGGESFAESWLTDNFSKQSQIANFIKLKQPIVFPLEQGSISIHVYDANNCFNVNSLGAKKNTSVHKNELGNLLDILELDSQGTERIVASIQDWVDSDAIPASGGAESMAYANLQPPYQAPNQLMVDISELREIQGVDEETYQQMVPFLCVGVDDKPKRLNLNTLSLEQAPLLATILGGRDGLQAAQAVITERPENGYSSVNQVWDLPVIEDLELKGAGKDKVDIQTNLIGMDIAVNYQEQSQKQKIVFQTGGANNVQLVSRRSVY